MTNLILIIGKHFARIEITESVFINDIEKVVSDMSLLKKNLVSPLHRMILQQGTPL